ncbi:MAG: A24 family peptidase [Thermanaeromonas sp.]|uniref:A24 family peptidase n=1 Tax=Thermanaeromonas sp. TaxID=2003697 RepID=UPI00243B55D3|nr:A24 family peptidase [Thermanaeromonas sp.]MCG0278068.1 A24 family peptidase [Thermanaeromonas sp.]
MVKDVVFLWLIFTCAFTDLKKRLIYNYVLLPALLLGFFLAGINGGLQGLKESGAGLALGFLLLALPYYLGGMGAGDVKMLATIGAIQGPLFTFYTFLCSALIGGIWALAYLVRHKRLTLLPGKGTSIDTLPYGAILALGALLTYLQGGWLY